MATDQNKGSAPPVRAWAPVVGLGWLIPGGGHFLLKRKGRGTLLLVIACGLVFCALCVKLLFRQRRERLAEVDR